MDVQNFIGGRWVVSAGRTTPVHNPATGAVIARAPESTPADVDAAVTSAARAFPAWRDTPPVQRARVLFAYRAALEAEFEPLARLITTEHGKTLDEARGSLRRGIECVEVASGAPSLLMGAALDQVAPGIDCVLTRRPLGVVAAITPFNFPAMVPLWFLPFAVASGNAFILKPSEQVPLTAQRLVALAEACGVPEGIVSLVHGGRAVAESLCDHPVIAAVSVVGSTGVARAVYQRATASGKRVQALGGAKNFIVMMPDADFDQAAPVVAESFFGCAGERCLAGAVLLPVGAAHAPARDRLIAAAEALQIGDGLDPATTLGPLVSAAHRDRVRAAVAAGALGPARMALDGRRRTVPEAGFFLAPSVFDDVDPSSPLGRDEIFGPVASITPVADLAAAYRVIDAHPNANAASIFTTSGRAAREFSRRATASMIGVNVGVAAPMAYFPFGGARDSFFGDLKVHGRDAFAFYSDSRVTITRW